MRRILLLSALAIVVTSVDGGRRIQDGQTKFEAEGGQTFPGGMHWITENKITK